ncbi:MAG: hemerythrin domain-containing protein [Wenzhouxiangellaceae bacterium]|nr:hemerythrin domain-containing protein [Wenzhouxiangellaceae bacterium]
MTATQTTASNASSAAFLQRLRYDHAGLSRMLRAIDSMVDRLATQPEAVQPALVEAFGYLLDYQHGYHHPREDRLFEKIRAKQPALADTLEKLAQEHETGERETAQLAEDLAAAGPDQLRGRQGQGLSARIHGYIRHTRLHMRDEEAVFYARAEQVLNNADWAEIIDDDGLQDPLADMAAFGIQHPALAAHFNVPNHHRGQNEITGVEATAPRHHVLALTDLYGGLLHEGLGLTRLNASRLLAVRGPISLVRAVTSITSANLRFAGQCLTRPTRWAIDTGTDFLVARLEPDQDA